MHFYGVANPRKCFVHYDSQSILVDYDSGSAVGSVGVNNFSNLKSGAATTSLEDCVEANPDDLLLVTPKFVNEVFVEEKKGPFCPKHQVIVFEGIADRFNNAPSREKMIALTSNGHDFTTARRFLSFEHMDHGCNYYRRYFADHGKNVLYLIPKVGLYTEYSTTLSSIHRHFSIQCLHDTFSGQLSNLKLLIILHA